MLITKKALPRRTFLRGAGATLALPLLDAMVPALSALSKTAANPVRRLGFIYFPNGANMWKWASTGEGTGFELSPTLRPLAPFRDAVTVLSGLDNAPADAWGDGSGDHARSGAAWLNATHPRKTEGADVRAATTIDQIAAAEFGQHTPLGSIELCLEPAGWVGLLWRHRLQLRLHRHDRVADPDDAAADGAQPAECVQPHVRGWSNGRGARDAAAT